MRNNLAQKEPEPETDRALTWKSTYCIVSLLRLENISVWYIYRITVEGSRHHATALQDTKE